MEDLKKTSHFIYSNTLYIIMVLFTLMFFMMAIVYSLINNCFFDIIDGFARILRTPAQCTHDAFSISVPGAFFNTGMCGLLILVYILFFGEIKKVNSSTIAAFFLSVGFGTWGMDIFNMLPPMLGIMIVMGLRKKDLSDKVNLGIFSTALSPLLTEVMLRWPDYKTTINGIEIVTSSANVTNLSFKPMGVVVAMIIGLIIGFVYPAVSKHASKMHLGYSLFNAGPAAGFLCAIFVGLLFKVTNIAIPTNGPSYAKEEFLFVFISYSIMFVICFIYGLLIEPNAIGKYIKLIKDHGHSSDFIEKYGIGAVLINFAVYGMFILLFYTLMRYLFGAKFGGPVVGVIFGAMTWVAAGAHPLNVLPIGIGYILMSLFSTVVCPLLDIGNDAGRLGMESVPILIGFAYATGMAPITGHYGALAGIIAGMLHFAIVTLTPNLYGGFNYYNGGMTAALVVFEFVPVLEEYWPRDIKDNENINN